MERALGIEPTTFSLGSLVVPNTINTDRLGPQTQQRVGRATQNRTASPDPEQQSSAHAPTVTGVGVEKSGRVTTGSGLSYSQAFTSSLLKLVDAPAIATLASRFGGSQ